MGVHDKIFRDLMKQKGVAEALVRERLPRHFAQLMAGPPALPSENFVEATLKGSSADVVMKVPLKRAQEVFVYCVVEHKRSEEKNALVQVRRYVTALYAWLARTNSSPLLPPVVPLVIYNGARSWRGPTQFRHALDDSSRLARHSVDFKVQFLDVSREPIDALSKHPTLRGGLLALRAAAVPTKKLPRVLDELLISLRAEPSTKDLAVVYLSQVLPDSSFGMVREAVRRHETEELKMQTIAQMLERRGYRKGEKRGEQKTLRTTLRRVLAQRFKKLPDDLDERLEKADLKTLNRWFDLALTAKSVREVFASP